MMAAPLTPAIELPENDTVISGDAGFPLDVMVKKALADGVSRTKAVMVIQTAHREVWAISVAFLINSL